jgi:hypothetical protein
MVPLSPLHKMRVHLAVSLAIYSTIVKLSSMHDP